MVLIIWMLAACGALPALTKDFSNNKEKIAAKSGSNQQGKITYKYDSDYYGPTIGNLQILSANTINNADNRVYIDDSKNSESSIRVDATVALVKTGR